MKTFHICDKKDEQLVGLCGDQNKDRRLGQEMGKDDAICAECMRILTEERGGKLSGHVRNAPKLIKAICRGRGISVRKLSRDLPISYSTLWRSLNDPDSMSLRTLATLSHHLRLDLDLVLVRRAPEGE